MFFDKDWNTLIDLYSYGHDIETSWLIDRGLEILNDPAVTEKLSPITDILAEQIYKIAYKDHSVINECMVGSGRICSWFYELLSEASRKDRVL